MQPENSKKEIECEELKGTYLSYLVESKIQMIGLTELKISNLGAERNW